MSGKRCTPESMPASVYRNDQIMNAMPMASSSNAPASQVKVLGMIFKVWYS